MCTRFFCNFATERKYPILHGLLCTANEITSVSNFALQFKTVVGKIAKITLSDHIYAKKYLVSDSESNYTNSHSFDCSDLVIQFISIVRRHAVSD